MVTDIDSNDLARPVSIDELKDVLHSFKKDKSPGPDGWTMEFFTIFFDLVGNDLLEMVEETRTLGKIIRGINSTFIALIPKSNKPTTFNDYRPISVCNLIYKVI
jgi:hypothetical protein